MPKNTLKLTAGRPSGQKAATAINMADDKKVIRLNFIVTAATRKKVKAYCLANDVTISKLFTDYIDTLKL